MVILAPSIAMIKISIKNIVNFYLKQIYGVDRCVK